MSDRSASYTRIVQLAAWLSEDRVLLWDEVEECVADFPAWQRLIARMRQMGSETGWSVFGRRPAAEGNPFEVSSAMHSRLYDIFTPYGLLLDQRHTLIERACRLEAAHYDAVEFCIKCCESGWLAEEALRMLEAIAEQQNLLRGASRPETAPEQLLRPAAPSPMAQDSLLLPVEHLPEHTAASSIPSGWLSKVTRSFRRNK